MPPTMTQPVGDSVPKVNNEIAVGSDLKFQRRWWRFETVVWYVFAGIVLLDVLGAFGKGPLAYAQITTSDGSMHIKYERIERLGTPSMMTIQFGGNSIRDGKVQLLVSESLVEELGNTRVVPQPAVSKIGGDQIMYDFPASKFPATVQLSLEPTAPGVHHLTLQVPGAEEAQANIYVVP